MGDGDDAPAGREVVEPAADARGQRGVAFAARRLVGPVLPGVPAAARQLARVARLDLVERQPVPGAPGHLVEPVVGRVFGRETHRVTDDLRASPGAAQRAGHHVEAVAVADQPGERRADPPSLVLAARGERRIELALDAAVAVPLGLAVTDEVDQAVHRASPRCVSSVLCDCTRRRAGRRYHPSGS